MDARQLWWHGLWPIPGTEEGSATDSWCHHQRTVAQTLYIPQPWSRKRHPTTHPCSLSVTMLPHECSALSHCSLDAVWSRRPRPFHSIYLCGQTSRVMTLPGNLKTWHPQCSLSNSLLKENKYFLLIPFGEKELCPSQHNFNWHLRLLELLGILVQEHMAELNSLWYSCLILIYLFLNRIQNLLSTSLLWLNPHCWNNQLLLFHQKNFQGC